MDNNQFTTGLIKALSNFFFADVKYEGEDLSSVSPDVNALLALVLWGSCLKGVVPEIFGGADAQDFSDALQYFVGEKTLWVCAPWEERGILRFKVLPTGQQPRTCKDNRERGLPLWRCAEEGLQTEIQAFARWASELVDEGRTVPGLKLSVSAEAWRMIAEGDDFAPPQKPARTLVQRLRARVRR